MVEGLRSVVVAGRELVAGAQGGGVVGGWGGGVVGRRVVGVVAGKVQVQVGDATCSTTSRDKEPRRE